MFVPSRRLLVSLVVVLAAGLSACAGPVAGSAPTPAAADEGEEEEWSMAVYPLVLLKAGARRAEPIGEQEGAELQAAHLAHIGAMAEAGHLLLAGPLIDRPGDDPIIGILLFRPGHEEAAQRLPADDPLIKAGRLRAEFMRWYGPAGLTYTGDPGPNAELEAELAEAAASAAASR